MNKSLKAASFFMYACAAALIVAYFYLDITETLRALIRLIFLCAICVFAYSASLFLAKTLEKSNAEIIMKVTFWVFFLLYIHLILTLVLFDSYFGRIGVSGIPKWSREAFENYFAASVNLAPFSTISEFITGAFTKTLSARAVIINIFGNLAAFTPFAFFMPLLFKRIRSFKAFFTFIVCTVCAVEILQLILLTGACDIDDLILNAIGACVAYAVFHIRSVKSIIEKLTLIKY